MRKELLEVIMATVLMVSLVFMSVSITFSDPGKPFVSADPQNTNIGAGQDFEINVTVTNVTSLYAFEINMTFDPNILNCTSAREGPFLNQSGSYISWWMSPDINNLAGYVHMSDSLFMMPYSGTSGSGTLAIVGFKALVEGSSNLNFTHPTSLSYMNSSGVLNPIDTDPPHNGTVTVTAGNDVAVISITAPDEAASSSTVPINVTVKNEGSTTEEVNVTIRYDSTYINSQNVTVDGGNSTTVPFTWVTTGLVGTYNITANATIPVDDDLTDNSKKKEIRIVEHDVAVTDVDAPNNAKVGESVSINVTVQNQGNVTENLNVTVSHNPTLIGYNDTVVLPSQNTTIVLFSWNTAGLAVGTYTINATAIIQTIPVDDDPADNNMTREIELYLLHDVNITNVEAPTLVPLGDTAYINVTVLNEGDYYEEANVTLEAEEELIGNETVSLAIGQSVNVSFTWDTSSEDPGYYTLWAKADVLPSVNNTGGIDDDEGDNFLQKLIILAVHDVNVSITAQSVVYPNFNVTIDVTVENQGYYIEKFNVTIYLNTTLLETFANVTLVGGDYTTITYIWNTTGVSYGNYTLTANATVLASTDNPGAIDDDPADNSADSPIAITIIADISGDGVVDFDDFITFAAKYGSQKGDGIYDVRCDLAPDDVIDFDDFIIFAAKYGQSI